SPCLRATHRGGARHVAVDLDAVTVRIAQIDDDGVAAVDNLSDGHAHLPRAPVEHPKLVSVLKAPRQFVGAGLLRALNERKLVFALDVAKHKGFPAGDISVCPHPEDFAVPLLCGECITDTDLAVLDLAAAAEVLDLMQHRLPLIPVGRSALV